MSDSTAPRLHPEATPDPAVLVWVVAPGPVSGIVDSDARDPLPPALSALVADGVLDRVRVRPGAVTTTLGSSGSWRELGPRVRSAILADLDQVPWPEPTLPEQTGDTKQLAQHSARGSVIEAGASGVTAADSAASGAAAAASAANARESSLRDGGGHRADDAALAESVRQLLGGPVGAVAASHGGSISFVAAHDGVVDVALHGACHGCPAAENTLGRRIEAELKRRHPGVRQVRQVDAAGRPVKVSSGRLHENNPARAGRSGRVGLRLLPPRNPRGQRES
ncbi:NifU family protein [Corynebacterium heidelbergense]|uniref:NIF system FeS cluster assembly NifU C-terminal domain-containing protein n=1 Tax=Corynebacterium heidelbergense TaxID=2055947 RepID=A0A364VEB6_9CORY|nr:NifU family protein [Corynebacterium heidelbergense]RAV34968.1 hypothetical protein CWC39_00465 [Corynebacterium heidelbergense]WCZ35892.1 Fe/S biogenesis protein NfuA [Corynebacterium heidelbergense]